MTASITGVFPLVKQARRRLPAVAITADKTTVVAEAPYDGVVSAASFVPHAAITGGTRAILAVTHAGANNDQLYTAVAPGAAGNSVSITLAKAGFSTPLSVSVSGTDITVALATGTDPGAVTSTTNEVNAAIAASAAAAALVVATATEGTGAGVIVEKTKTSLAGGVDVARKLTLVNTGQAGIGTTAVASLSYSTGTNSLALDEKALTLSAVAGATVVATGDILEVTSVHTAAGLADPGGLFIVEFTRT